MPTPTKGPRLGGSPAHERLMLANLATSLFEHDRITTTEAKAKRLRPLAERLITFAKKGDLHARRRVLAVVHDKDVVHKLFAEIGPKFAERPGGYTRIVKINPRKGDNAPMAVIELVEALTAAQSAVKEGERARGTKVAPRKAVTGRTRELAKDAAAESPTAAAVAADADADDIESDADSTVDSTVDSAVDSAVDSESGAAAEEGMSALGLDADQVSDAADSADVPEAGGELAAAPDASAAPTDDAADRADDK